MRAASLASTPRTAGATCSRRFLRSPARPPPGDRARCGGRGRIRAFRTAPDHRPMGLARWAAAVVARIVARMADELSARPAQVTAAVELIDGGATVPFIARYRKEATGGLDDTQLRTLEQ